MTFPAPLHSVAQDQEAAEVQRVLARQLGRRAITVFRATLNSDQETIQKMGEFRVGADLWMLTCPVCVSLSGLHRLRSAADARVHHRRATEHHPGRVDVPVLLLNPDACAYVTDITPKQIVTPRARGFYRLLLQVWGVAAVCRNRKAERDATKLKLAMALRFYR